MRHKKRFEQIETGNPVPVSKPSLLRKVLFRRKLEISGIEREKLEIPEKLEKTDLIKCDVKMFSETKSELEENLREIDKSLNRIELENRRKAEYRAKQLAIEFEKKRIQEQKSRLDRAKVDVADAQNRIFSLCLGIIGAGFVLWYTVKHPEVLNRRHPLHLWLSIGVVVLGVLIRNQMRGGRR